MFNSLKNEKKKIELELEEYYLEKKATIDRRVITHRESCQGGYASIEHAYHEKKEKYGIELAELKAEIENKKIMRDIKKYNTELMKEKDNTIKQLQEVIKNLTNKDVLVYSGQKQIKND